MPPPSYNQKKFTQFLIIALEIESIFLLLLRFLLIYERKRHNSRFLTKPECLKIINCLSCVYSPLPSPALFVQQIRSQFLLIKIFLKKLSFLFLFSLLSARLFPNFLKYSLIFSRNSRRSLAL